MKAKACQECKNSSQNGGNCLEYTMSDGYYAWRTPIFQGDEGALLHQQSIFNGGTFSVPSLAEECNGFAPIEMGISRAEIALEEGNIDI